MYIIFDRMAKNEEASKAAKFIEKKKESKQTATSVEGSSEPSDKKKDWLIDLYSNKISCLES